MCAWVQCNCTWMKHYNIRIVALNSPKIEIEYLRLDHPFWFDLLAHEIWQIYRYDILCCEKYLHQSDRLKQQGKSEGFDSCDRPSNLTLIGFKSSIFQPLWPWNLMDDPPKKNNRAPLLCYFKLFASFHSHWWIQTGVTVWKPLIWVNIDAF